MFFLSLLRRPAQGLREADRRGGAFAHARRAPRRCAGALRGPDGVEGAVDRGAAARLQRHVGHLTVPSHARHFVRQRPRKAANERGGLYHAVITPASVACLAEPLPPLAWVPLPPPVTTPFQQQPQSAGGVVTGETPAHDPAIISSSMPTASGQRPMSLRDQMLGIFSTASHREDADYSKHIPSDAKYATLMCYRDVVHGSQAHLVGHLMSDPGGEWLREVVRQLGHAHLEIDRLLASGDLSPHDHPLNTLSKYLLAERTPSSHFLDFLELSLGPTLESHIARDNEFVDGLNLALDRRASPYLLTRYAYIREEYGRWPIPAFQRWCQHIGLSAGVSEAVAASPATRYRARPPTARRPGLYRCERRFPKGPAPAARGRLRRPADCLRRHSRRGDQGGGSTARLDDKGQGVGNRLPVLRKQDQDSPGPTKGRRKLHTPATQQSGGRARPFRQGDHLRTGSRLIRRADGLSRFIPRRRQVTDLHLLRAGPRHKGRRPP